MGEDAPEGWLTLRSSLPGTAISGELKRGESVLGRCVVDRRLRRDRLTAVYLARGREPGEVFSVWAVHSAVIARSERAAYVFGLELERLTLLEHPGIPTIIAFDAADSGPVVISARRPGSSLREIIASGSDRSAKLGAKVLQGLARILELLHTQSPPVLHRGLVPERVVLDEEGEVHLEECGYLHALVTAGFVTDRTVLACGQPGYLLPEELAFPPTPALDVFALATLLFELFTGHLPFGEASAAELATALRADQLPTLSTYRDDLAAGVDAVFERAFGIARGEGYPTVQAFARDLLRALEPDHSARLTLPGNEIPGPESSEELGVNLSIAVDPEPTPSYGNYGAILAELDARRAGASPLPETRELASNPHIPPLAPLPDLGEAFPDPPSRQLASSKRTLPGGSFALAPGSVARLDASAGVVVAAHRLAASAQAVVGSARAPRAASMQPPTPTLERSIEGEPEEISADAVQSYDGEAIDLSSRDLQSIADHVRDHAGRHDALMADQPTQVSPLPQAERLTRPSGLGVSPPRTSSTPAARPTPTPRTPSGAPVSAPPRSSVPSGLLAPSRLPAPARLPADLGRVSIASSSPPPTAPDAAQLFAQAARLLAVSTVIAAVCVTTGLLYMARASDELGAALRSRTGLRSTRPRRRRVRRLRRCPAPRRWRASRPRSAHRSAIASRASRRARSR
jgi:serine/threonine protein kinase